MKAKRSSEEDSKEANQESPKVFSPEVERQMEDHGLRDEFLKMHFENLMKPSTASDSLLEESFTA